MCNCFNKCMLIAINVVFLIFGVAITAVSIWVIASQGSLFEFMQLLTKDVNVDSKTMDNYLNGTSTLLAAAYIAVAFGGLSIIIGFCGCCGAIKENACMLIFYAVSISIILAAEIAGAIVAAVFKNQISKELKPRFITLEKNHFIPLNQTLSNESSTDVTITTYINYLQVSLECCGVNNQSDITGSDTKWSKSERYYNGLPQVMPVTCCKMKSTKNELLSKNDWKNSRDYLSDPTCPNTGMNSLTEGCYNKLEKTIDFYALPIIIVCVVVAVFEIFCVVIASCMVNKIRKDDGTHV
ncbi:hypothetical protein BOX15_Mlig020035g1 [Macrostomum lignano]|uniref:Tetraspanin n=2 Tax=Macrostomum lignano TaxID=282301 RepID=A0A267GUI3_9PLAT|nr:hypothetical protein BOX15_Mlig020035g1 [Macrostomum lignano]